jgi:hypothetical protein
LNSVRIELSRQEIGEFVSAFDRGVLLRVDTPRASKRYGNALMFALPMLSGEVNTVDLLLLEALRAFYPHVYEVVRNQHVHFSGVKHERHHGDADGELSGKILKPILDGLDDEERRAARSLLEGLFPRLRNVGYGSDWLEKWARDRRLCSPEYCSRYFSYAIPRNDLSDRAVDELIEVASTKGADAVASLLEQYFKDGKAKRLIDKLRMVENSVQDGAIPSLCIAVAKIARLLPNPPSLFDHIEPPGQAAILISHLIRRLPASSDRIATSKQVLEHANPLWFAAECIRWLNVTDKPDKANHNTLTGPERDEVRKVLVERIKYYAADGNALFDVDNSKEISLLYEWWRGEGTGPVESHLLGLFKRDPKLIGRFLLAIAPRAWGQNDVVPHTGDIGGSQVKNIKLVVNLDKLAGVIRKNMKGDFDSTEWVRDSNRPDEQRLAEQFMYIYNKWKKDGEPPDSVQEESEE